MDEFIPLQHFYRLSRMWWLIVLTSVLGLGFAYLFHTFNPPVYQATASLNVTIDLTQFQLLTDIPKDKLQYNEDLALSITDQAFHSPEAYQTVLTRGAAQGLDIDSIDTLYANHSLERKHAIWQLHYRHSDPLTAQAVADSWAQVAYENMVTWQATEQIPAYLIVKPPVLALLPQQPMLYDLYRLLLAGGLIGFIIGIIFSNLLARKVHASQINLSHD